MTSENMPPIWSRLWHFSVIDRNDFQAGTVEGIWVDPSGERLEYLGVKYQSGADTMPLVPGDRCRIDDASQAVHIPFDDTQVHGAPAFTYDHSLTVADRQAIEAHYATRWDDDEQGA